MVDTQNWLEQATCDTVLPNRPILGIADNCDIGEACGAKVRASLFGSALKRRGGRAYVERKRRWNPSFGHLELPMEGIMS